ncbi:MAG: hypothetical protein J0M17_18770 [Planctomycetes bacterium]|nr:hypothetical protein [Planctomycetota bacterium]
MTDRTRRLRVPQLFALVTATLVATVVVMASPQSANAELKAGAAVVDVTPKILPVLVNGSMLTRTVGTVNTPVQARAVALADGDEQVVIVVVDSCMMGRDLLDEAKSLASKRTGIATDRMLISATHAHSAPASMGCLGTDADPAYVPFLRDKLVEVISAAQANLEPARVGFGKANAASFTAVRQWIRRPDRLAEDPFGNPTVRANMHAGRKWDEAVGEAGPEDPDLAIISLQAKDGRPIAVLGNFSMHYFGDKDISADYFGLFCKELEQRIGKPAAGGKPFVGIMSHGCSGDIYRVDYTVPESERNTKIAIADYARGLADIAMKAYSAIKYDDNADLAMAERRMTLRYRVPDKQRLEWAERMMKEMGDRPPKTQPEVYAREQILLHQKQQTQIVVQALRIGDIGIATTPNETYAITGLKIKAASPLAHNMVIELANGGDGYIPPPEQHAFGGYNTWPARSAGLQVDAEPKIMEAAVELLEDVSGKPRKPWQLADGPAAKAVLDAKPVAYWRLNEFTGPIARDSSGRGRDAGYEPAITYYLAGPKSDDFCSADDVNRAPHFVGGRLRSRLPELNDKYTVSLWIWNGMPVDGRPVTGWMLSRGHDQGLAAYGEHLGLGGTAGHAGKLIHMSGNDARLQLAGKTEVPRWTWSHVALVRDGAAVRVYLNGALEIESSAPVETPADVDGWFFGGRTDNDSNWEGRLDEISVFDRALTPAEIQLLR